MCLIGGQVIVEIVGRCSLWVWGEKAKISMRWRMSGRDRFVIDVIALGYSAFGELLSPPFVV